jgi:3-oxoacyl-[acyl-carrier protein] reductase
MAMSSKRILITGGSSGIGAAIVTSLTERGFVVDIITSKPDFNPVGLRGDGRLIRTDLSDWGSLEQISSVLTSDYYGFVHSAGVAHDALVPSINLERARTLMDLNFWSFAQIAKLLLPGMMRRRDGRIVAIASIAANVGRRGNGMYSASKGALVSLVRCISAECVSRDVTANCVLPGFVETPMLEKYPPGSIPQGCLSQPADVASLVGYLVSDEARNVTGANFVVDRGLSSRMDQ